MGQNVCRLYAWEPSQDSEYVKESQVASFYAVDMVEAPGSGSQGLLATKVSWVVSEDRLVNYF